MRVEPKLRDRRARQSSAMRSHAGCGTTATEDLLAQAETVAPRSPPTAASTARRMSPGDTVIASSRTGLNGTGTSSQVTRVGGAKKFVPAMLGDDCSDFRRGTAGPSCGISHDESAGLAHRCENRLPVEGNQRAGVDDLDRYALRLELLCDSERLLHERTQGNDGDIGALAAYGRGPSIESRTALRRPDPSRPRASGRGGRRPDLDHGCSRSTGPSRRRECSGTQP